MVGQEWCVLSLCLLLASAGLGPAAALGFELFQAGFSDLRAESSSVAGPKLCEARALYPFEFGVLHFFVVLRSVSVRGIRERGVSAGNKTGK